MCAISFIQLLNKEIGLSKKKSKKQIIHFRTNREYRQCMMQLKNQKYAFPALSTVRGLGIIRAVSCSIRSSTRFLQFPGILCIEEDRRIRVHPLSTSKQITQLHRYRNRNSPVIPWGVEQISAPEAWNRSLGKHIKIGVIDTGIDYQHPDLRDSIGKSINLLNPHLLAWDDNGHGTHIAGTIAGASQQLGVVGVAPRAVIHPVKAFDQYGSAYVSDIIAGIDWCVQQKIQIINMSFGMKTFNKSLQTAVLHAYRSGTIIVASSGNDGKKSSVDFPARFPQVVSVGATTRKKTIAHFTNCGKGIDVFAPGERIFSTWLHGEYHEMSGTSMATAHVSGVTALMLSIRPRLKPRKIKLILKRTASALKMRSSALIRTGQVNARRALSALNVSKS